MTDVNTTQFKAYFQPMGDVRKKSVVNAFLYIQKKFFC